MPNRRADGFADNKLKALVSLGLGAGYLIVIRSNVRSGQKASAVGNSILLPASLVWLWFVTNRDGE